MVALGGSDWSANLGKGSCAFLRDCCSVAKDPYLKPAGLEAVLLGLPVVVWGGRSMEEGAGGAV